MFWYLCLCVDIKVKCSVVNGHTHKHTTHTPHTHKQTHHTLTQTHHAHTNTPRTHKHTTHTNIPHHTHTNTPDTQTNTPHTHTHTHTQYVIFPFECASASDRIVTGYDLEGPAFCARMSQWCWFQTGSGGRPPPA
jgi:hypothetical protein